MVDKVAATIIPFFVRILGVRTCRLLAIGGLSVGEWYLISEMVTQHSFKLLSLDMIGAIFGFVLFCALMDELNHNAR